MAVGAVLAGALGACGGDDGEAAEGALDGAVGFGEQRDSAFGAHTVAGLVALGADDVDAPGLRVDDDEDLVGAVVSECAGRGQSGVVSRQGWSAILADGSRVDSPVEPVPATEGAPPIDATRRVSDGCRWARVLFVVPDGEDVVGVHHEADGARTTTWRASDRALEEIR